MCANEAAIHQPKVVHHIATVYARNMYLFQRSFVSLPRREIPTVFSKVSTTLRTLLSLTLFPLTLERIPRVKRGLTV